MSSIQFNDNNISIVNDRLLIRCFKCKFIEYQDELLDHIVCNKILPTTLEWYKRVNYWGSCCFFMEK